MLPKLLLSLCLLIGSTHSAEIVDPETCESFPCKIFEDNFDTLDMDVWNHEITMGGGGNFEFQAYVNNRSVSYVKDGILFIKPQLVSNWKGEEFLESGDMDLWGMNGRNMMCTGNSWEGCRRVGTPESIVNPVMSARLRTLGAFSYKYGKLEVRAKLPRGQWMWPAVWLLPDGFHYGDWPASGEIDIFEMRGNDVYGDDVGNEYGGSTIHWGPYLELNRFPWTHQPYPSPDGGRLTDDYHTWTVEWTDHHFRYWLDDNETPYFEVEPITSFWDFGNFSQVGDIDNPWVNGEKMAPFDKKFYILINIAIGGTGGYFPDNVLSEPAKPWTNDQTVREAITSFWQGRDDWLPTWQHGEEKISEDAALKVDYVRVWKIKDKNI